MGDAAYTDNIPKAQWFTDNSMPLEYMQKKFNETKYDPYYVDFVKSTQAVIGVWDDHDMGCNNADKRFSKKRAVRDMYLDFLDEPKDSVRRMDRDHGIFEDYVVRTIDGIKIHIILIDVRYEYDH